MSRNRASRAQLTQRRKEIQELIIQGHTKTYIIDSMSEKWKTSKRAIQEDINIIGKEWAEKAPEETQKLRNKYEERLEWLFCEAAGNGQLKTALDIQKEIQKLNGVNKADEDEATKIPEFINIGRRSSLKVVGDDE